MSWLPNFGYHLARFEARIVRSVYSAAKPMHFRAAKVELPFEVYSYSGEEMLAEQIASIRSLLHYAGRPKQFTIVSDGTHSTRSLELLRSLDPIVKIARAEDFVPSAVSEKLRVYLTSHPTGKQLALVMSLPRDGAALYIDSDVLFFKGAAELRSIAIRTQYLADCQVSADQRLFRDASETQNPVNTGVLFLVEKLDWSLGIRRFLELEGAPNFFTNQTITHLTMHANGARPFDPQKFVLQLDDQFVYRDTYASRDLVLRHYVNPVRHKFWNALWRKQG